MIESFQDLYETKRIKTDHLLIGNGFSIGIWQDFNYKSLYDNQKESLKKQDRLLFSELKTTNFEYVLENIKRAISINKIFNRNNEELSYSYNNIKEALINGVANVHPNNFNMQLYSKIGTNNTFNIFKKSIFTTNYDLIPYWLHIKLSRKERLINDFFRLDDLNSLKFLETSKNNSSLNLYYLHGGLHIFVNKVDLIEKVKKNNNHKYLIDAVIDSMKKNNMPLYVSEGNWEDKLEQIQSNKYLRFCHEALSKIDGHLTIFGHDLSDSADKHIVDAINKSKIEVIAYGIYELDKKEAISERIRTYFPQKEVHFFNSTSFDKSVEFLANL